MKILGRALAVALAGTLPGASAYAQAEVAEIYSHIGHAAESYPQTPTGQGLLPTAVAEADIALQHARLALADSVSLVGMRRHAGHVVHALDPSVVSGAGPGLGYGVRMGAGQASQHVGLAAAGDSASENVTTHALHIVTALGNAVRWSDQALELAQSIQTAPSVAAAAPLVSRLATLCHAIRWGRDADGDGVVGWQDGEGGLAQATYHLNLLRRGEGLAY